MKINYIAIILMIISTNNIAKADNFIGLFGDITVEDREHESVNHDSFSGTLDLYLVHTFTNEFSILIEHVYDNLDSHITNHTERYSLKYSFTPKINLAIGRFHTPLGNLNRTLHHGTLLQDTVTRPFFLSFHNETAILPLHVVGFLADGIFRQDDNLNIGYETSLHSSQSIDTAAHAHNSHIEIDPNNNLSGSIDPGFSLRLRLYPDSRDWLYGVSLLNHNTESEDPASNTQIEQTIVGIDAQYSFDNWKLTSEYFHIKNTDRILDKEFSSNAIFIEGVYSLTESLRAIYRYETINLDVNDTYYSIFHLNEQNRQILAMRYDLNDNHAFKVQFESIDYKIPVTNDTYSIYAQWSFLVN